MRVTVVGAGLGGLAAAVALHRAGHEVSVVERAEQPREDGAGIGIMPNGVRALDALGLGEPVRAQAAPMAAGGGFRDRHGRVLLVTDQAAVARRTGAPLVVAARRWLHGLLAAALPEGMLKTDCPVHDLDDVDGDVVVVADGARSRLRAQLFPDHPGLAGSGETAARSIAPAAPPGVATVAGELLDRHTGERFGCMPMADGRVYWYATWPGVAVEPAEPAARLRWLADRRGDWHPAVVALIESTPADEVHVVETVQLVRPLPTLVAGRVALLGDAAHAMTPDLGQGACQAFEDAVALGAALTGTEDITAALARYDARRGPRTAALQRATRRAHRVLTLRGPAALVRDTLMRGVPTAMATRAMAAQLRFDPEPDVDLVGGGH